MFGLTRRLPAVAPRGAGLEVRPAKGAAFTVDVGRLRWVMFVRCGDALFANEAGWWVFARAEGGATALGSGCAGLEMAVRGPLRATLDGAGARLSLDLGEAPAALAGGAARAGWATLSAAAAAALVDDPGTVPLASVADAPLLP